MLDTDLLLLFERFVIFDKISHRALLSRSPVIQRKVRFVLFITRKPKPKSLSGGHDSPARRHSKNVPGGSEKNKK